MPPDVLLRKLAYLRQLLADLAPFQNMALTDMMTRHYTVERLFELLVMTASDILFHELAAQGISPDSYRDAFRLAGTHNLIPQDLSAHLQKAAGMRNIIVHLYQDVDLSLIHISEPTRPY